MLCAIRGLLYKKVTYSVEWVINRRENKMSKNSKKQLVKQLLSWLSNELHHGKGHKRVRDKKGNYIKVKKWKVLKETSIIK